MRNFQVELKTQYPVKGGVLKCYLTDRPSVRKVSEWKRPAVIIVPGGSYRAVCQLEAEPIALEFLSRGFHAFVLNYVVAGEQGEPYPEQLLELGSAIDYVKQNAEEFYVNRQEIFILGFSAGGHLTANLCVEYSSIQRRMGKEMDCKPTAVGLCYPVISKKNGHQRSFDNLLYGYSETEKEELLKTLNLNEAVTKDTPPAFIWTKTLDPIVPSDNALRYAQALYNNGVLYELHVYPYPGHGGSALNSELHPSGIAPPQNKRMSRWMDDCAEFFRLFIEENF